MHDYWVIIGILLASQIQELREEIKFFVETNGNSEKTYDIKGLF